jgi:hypothetical protein
VAATLVGPGAASAQPAPGAGPAGDVASSSTGLVPVFDPERGVTKLVGAAVAAKVITDYWTPARRAAATPATPPARTTDSGSASDQSSGPARAIAKPRAGSGVSAAVAFTHADGKVFFHDPVDNTDHACSGGTVNSGKRRLVVTAGHCVHGGSGRQWMTNWVFYPGYQFGAGPAGAFPAFQLWTKNGWINDNDRHFDYGIAITQTNASGQLVVDRVGGNGLIVNPGRPFVTAIAYPVNFNNGEQQAFCQGTLSRRSIFISDQQLNCDLRFGASGGPWLQDYSDTTTLGWIVSNQSYSLNSDGSGPEYGPYYDDDTTSLYNAAEAASP